MIELKTPCGSDVSPLCFGCMQFGGTADEATSRRMFDTCRDAGINFFDTAHTYTGGLSETFLGAFIKNERDELLVATKAGYTGGSGRANILKQFDESRRRLSVDVVDILYMHRWDQTTPLQETIETLSVLQQQGRLRHIGVSNFAAWQIMKAQAIAQQMDTRIDVIQPMYSLVKRQAEVEILPMAQTEQIAVAAYSPLGGGLLTGKYQTGGTGRLTTDTRYAARYGLDWMTETATKLAAVAKETGKEAASLAVAWAAHHPAVTVPIISARNVKQLEPSLAAMHLELSPDDYEDLSALSPRPAPATDRLEETT